MTSIVTIVQTDRAHVLTDATAYQEDGTIVMIGTKAFVLPQLPAVLAIRGPATARPILGEIISNAAASFDELRLCISDLLHQSSVAYSSIFETCKFGPDFEVVVAGISATDGACAYIVATHTRYGNQPFEVIPIKGLTAIPNTAVISSAMVPLMPASGNADDIDVAKTGLAVMEIQRANPDMGDGHCRVGGFAQLTTVTAEAVTSRIVHRWPDEVGERLGA